MKIARSNAALWLAIVIACVTSTLHAQDTRPNILFFLVDDMGTQDTSEPFFFDSQGQVRETPLNARYRTPNIERLAAQGMKFTQAYSCSVCTPTRVSIMTGMNSARHRVTTWTHPATPKDTGSNQEKHLRSPDWRIAGVDETDILLPRLLGEAGYRTIHCGKAHFGANGTFGGDPRNLGFEVNIAGHGAGGPGSYHGVNNFSAAWRNGSPIWDVPGLEAYHGQDIFLTEALTVEMKDAIKKAVQDEKPFFAYMAHYAVHAPFEVDDRFRDNYPDLKGKDLAFATMVEGMDKSLGDLLAHLEALGVAENTLVIFTSDNGSDGPLNRPLRGKKGMRHEGGIRVPMIAAWAKSDPDNPLQRALSIPPGAVEDDVVTCEDLFPTVATMAGVKFDHAVDGRDLSAYFRGLPGTHRPPEYLLHFPHGHNHDHFTVYRKGPWKIIYSYGPEQWELYNLSADPSEKRNLLAVDPILARAMAARMIQWIDRYDAQLPLRSATQEPVMPNRGAIEAAVRARSEEPEEPLLPGDDLDLAALTRPVTDENLFRDEEWFNWCNSIVKDEAGTYHLFYARWPKSIGFFSWLTHSEIARAVAERPEGPYTFVETVIPSRGSDTWNQITAHNVKVERFGGRYYLYRIGTNDGGRNLTEADLVAIAKQGYSHPDWMVLRNNQRTGVAVADRIEGPWRTLPRPVVEPAGPVSTVSVNPDVWQGTDERFYMIFKGDFPGVGVAQALAIADRPEGPFRVEPEIVYRNRRTEDTSVWWDPVRKLYYGILHDLNGFGLIASPDGIHWREARNYRAADKQIEFAGTDPLTPARYERPFVYTENGVPRVLGGAVREKDGDAYIVLVPLE
jgi:arylsulfatase A-like enzyme